MLRRYERAGELTPRRGGEALEDLASVTRDRRLAAVPGHGARVEVLPGS